MAKKPQHLRNFSQVMNQTAQVNQFNITKQSQDIVRQHYQFEGSKPDTMSTHQSLPMSAHNQM